MNLIIDQGNSRTKIALFEGDELSQLFENDSLSIDFILYISRNYPIKGVILSAVKQISTELLFDLQQMFTCFIQLNWQTPLPIGLAYKTPETLGVDRIAAVVGAMSETNSPVIVIDAGTAITFDFMDERSVFQGGSIAPGMKMRFAALNHYTDKLPVVEPLGDLPVLGYDTTTAIRSGVVNGMRFEIEGFIDLIRSNHPSVLVFLTGGDSIFFAEIIKYPIFVDKNLVLKGLNRILNYNVER